MMYGGRNGLVEKPNPRLWSKLSMYSHKIKQDHFKTVFVPYVFLCVDRTKHEKSWSVN